MIRRLPGKDGIETCAEIRAKKDGWKSKVIIITGMGGDEVLERATKAGCSSFYNKPINMRQLKMEVLSFED